jgi:hypothetical protein
MAIGKVSLRGIFFEDFMLAFNISGAVDPVADVGKAVMLDTTAPNTVKLANVVDARIIGRLESIEARTVEGITVGTVAITFCDVLPHLAGQVFTVGSTAVASATPGQVKVAAAADPNQNLVVEVLANGDPVVLKTGN